MQKYVFVIVGLLAVVALPAAAWAQGRSGFSIGSGPSMNFTSGLPSSRIGQGMGGGYTSASQFTGGPGGGINEYYSPGSQVSLARAGWSPVSATDLSPGLAPFMVTRVRSIDSMNFEKRARFAKLRETTMALAEKVREVQGQGAKVTQISSGFRQFMFPVPIVDRPELGYGFFSKTDLVGGGTVNTEALVAPFTAEVQQSLGEKRYLALVQSLLTGQPSPDAMSLDQCYDTQLAALGNFLFNNSRYLQAANCYSAMADRDPTNAAARRGVALSLLAARNTKRAAAEARASLIMAPGWPDKTRITGSNLDDVFPAARDLAEARAELEAQLAAQPADANLNFLLAYMDLFQGRMKAAEDRLAGLGAADDVSSKLLALVRSGAVADTVRRPIGSALKRVADELTGLEEAPLSAKAREALIDAIRTGGSTYEDFMRVGDFRFFMGDFTLADEAYRSAHKAKPQDAFALFALTHASFANGEYKQAARYLGEALAIEPNWGLYEFKLQEFYGDPAELDRQIKDAERLIELRPRAADMKFLLAYIYYFSGRYSDAADLLVQVLKIEPGQEKANYFLRLAKLQG